MDIDYYKVLGLKRTVSNFDILNAYVPITYLITVIYVS